MRTIQNSQSEFNTLHAQDEWSSRSNEREIKKILQIVTKTYRDWHVKLPFSLFAYQTSIRFSLVMVLKLSCQLRQKFRNYIFWWKPSLRKLNVHGPIWPLKNREWSLYVTTDVTKGRSLRPMIRKSSPGSFKMVVCFLRRFYPSEKTPEPIMKVLMSY